MGFLQKRLSPLKDLLSEDRFSNSVLVSLKLLFAVVFGPFRRRGIVAAAEGILCASSVSCKTPCVCFGALKGQAVFPPRQLSRLIFVQGRNTVTSVISFEFDGISARRHRSLFFGVGVGGTPM